MISETQLVLFMLVLARVSAFVAFFPLFARRQLPNLVKLGLAAALSVFWFSEADPAGELVQSTAGLWAALHGCLLIVKEVAIGVVLAITLGLFFWPARVAGAYIGQELGLSLAAITDPGSEDSSTIVTRILEAFSILMFFSIDLHHFVVLVLHESFQGLFGRVGVLQLPTEYLVQNLVRVNEYGLLLIAPLVVLLLLVTLLLVFLNRAAPTMNLFSIGMTIRVSLGLFGMLLFCPIILPAVATFLYKTQADITHLLRFLS